MRTSTRQSPDRHDRTYLDRLDEVARTLERRWGIGRLPLLVDPALHLRFDRQREKLKQAIAADNAEAIVVQAEGMTRAWHTLDAAATAAGAEPLAPEVWECSLPASGKVVAIVRTAAEALHVAKDREVWALAEIALLIERMGDGVPKVKSIFSGATLIDLRQRALAEELDDEIPF